MKKIFAFLLTFAMLFSLAMPAMAAENDSQNVTATYNPTYTVTVNESQHGKVEANPARSVADTEITLTITPDEGFELDQLTVKDASDGDVTVGAGYTFKMPASNVTVTATFKEAVNTYTVTIDTNIENGEVTVNPSTYTAGQTVTLAVNPAEGYQIGTVTVKDAQENIVEFIETGVASGVYKFTMPASNVTVTASFEKLATTSAEISWGSMAFTYTDGENGAEDGAWTADTAEKAGQATVKNTGDTAFTATPSFVDNEDDYGTFSGSFDVASATLNAGEESTFTLSLSGAPTKAITAGTKIGTVTVTIDETEIVTVVTTCKELADAMNAGGTVQMGNSITNNQVSQYLTSPAVLDLNGYTYTNIWYYSATKSLHFNSTITIKDSRGNGGIACEAEDCLYALYLGSTSSDVTVYGGIYSSNNSAAQVYQGTLTIYDGTFNGGQKSLTVGGSSDAATVKIYGGTFIGGIRKQSGPVTIEIYGGTFDFDPSTYVDLTNYEVTESNGTWTVTAR